MLNEVVTYTLFFDGCARGNPGKAGAGSALFKNQVEISTQSHFLGNHVTNNVAEYKALIIGLKDVIDHNIKKVNVKGDSMRVIKQLNGEFKVSSPSIKPLYNEVKLLISRIGNVTFEHVYREFNKRADGLANDAL